MRKTLQFNPLFRDPRGSLCYAATHFSPSRRSQGAASTGMESSRAVSAASGSTTPWNRSFMGSTIRWSRWAAHEVLGLDLHGRLIPCRDRELFDSLGR